MFASARTTIITVDILAAPSPLMSPATAPFRMKTGVPTIIQIM